MDEDLKPTDVLACFFAKVAEIVGSGKLGNVSRAVVYIRSESHGPDEPAIVFTYPMQPDDETVAELEAAAAWVREPAADDLRLEMAVQPPGSLPS